eukprot:763050-Hanusia_phi.AAC.2
MDRIVGRLPQQRSLRPCSKVLTTNELRFIQTCQLYIFYARARQLLALSSETQTCAGPANDEQPQQSPALGTSHHPPHPGIKLCRRLVPQETQVRPLIPSQLLQASPAMLRSFCLRSTAQFDHCLTLSRYKIRETVAAPCSAAAGKMPLGMGRRSEE